MIFGWLATRQMEYKKLGTIVLVTEKKNLDMACRVHVEPVTCMEEALQLAFGKCGVKDPKIIVMPQGANTLPIQRF